MHIILLSKEFFNQNTVAVAKSLLGKTLIRVINGAVLKAMIVETEAYTFDDPACHAFRGKTVANRALFGPVGHAYIYFIYGNHFCFNAVAFDENQQKAGGVLIRAVEPIEGIEVMQQHRQVKKLKQISNGPGKLAQALRIDKQQYGIDLTQEGELFLAHGIMVAEEQIVCTTRIGISQAQDYLWRFYIRNNPFVSK